MFSGEPEDLPILDDFLLFEEEVMGEGVHRRYTLAPRNPIYYRSSLLLQLGYG